MTRDNRWGAAMRLCGAAAAVVLLTAGSAAQSGSGSAALELHDRYLAAWNARDADAFAATLHYPHASGGALWPDAAEYAAALDFEPLIARGWVRSLWDARSVVQAGDDKVHVAGRALRLDAEGRTLQTLQTLYVITRRDGRWGVEARFSAGPPVDDRMAEVSRRAAAGVVDAYLEAVNRRDSEAFAATLHYPHIRVAAGGVQTWEQAQEVASATTFERLAATGWARSAWDAVEPFQVSRDAVNVALELSRYDAAGTRIARFHTLYLITRENGRWGIKARSSFAPR